MRHTFNEGEELVENKPNTKTETLVIICFFGLAAAWFFFDMSYDVMDYLKDRNEIVGFYCRDIGEYETHAIGPVRFQSECGGLKNTMIRINDSQGIRHELPMEQAIDGAAKLLDSFRTGK